MVITQSLIFRDKKPGTVCGRPMRQTLVEGSDPQFTGAIRRKIECQGHRHRKRMEMLVLELVNSASIGCHKQSSIRKFGNMTDIRKSQSIWRSIFFKFLLRR